MLFESGKVFTRELGNLRQAQYLFKMSSLSVVKSNVLELLGMVESNPHKRAFSVLIGTLLEFVECLESSEISTDELPELCRRTDNWILNIRKVMALEYNLESAVERQDKLDALFFDLLSMVEKRSNPCDGKFGCLRTEYFKAAVDDLNHLEIRAGTMVTQRVEDYQKRLQDHFDSHLIQYGQHLENNSAVFAMTGNLMPIAGMVGTEQEIGFNLTEYEQTKMLVNELGVGVHQHIAQGASVNSLNLNIFSGVAVTNAMLHVPHRPFITWYFGVGSKISSVQLRVDGDYWSFDFERQVLPLQRISKNFTVVTGSQKSTFEMLCQRLKPDGKEAERKITVLSGHAGVGKSFLVLRYLYDQKSLFSTAWFTLDTDNELDSFDRQWSSFAQTIRNISGISGKYSDDLVICTWLEQLPSEYFIVLDSAAMIDIQKIVNKLPAKGGQIVIISRHCEDFFKKRLNDFEFHYVPPFTSDESVIFLELLLGQEWMHKSKATEEFALESIIACLGGYPAALVQFVSFLRKKYISLKRYWEQMSSSWDAMWALTTDTLMGFLPVSATAGYMWYQSKLLLVDILKLELLSEYNELYLDWFLEIILTTAIKSRSGHFCVVLSSLCDIFHQYIVKEIKCCSRPSRISEYFLRVLPKYLPIIANATEPNEWIISASAITVFKKAFPRSSSEATVYEDNAQEIRFDFPLSLSFTLEDTSAVGDIQINILTAAREISIWQLPTRNDGFIPRPKATDELIQKLDSHVGEVKCLVLTAAVSGMGGVGKTELALHFIHCKATTYKYRFWFNATNDLQLMSEFRQFGKALNIVSNSDSAEKIKSKVRNWLQLNCGWIMVLDNADEYNKIHDWIPNKGGTVLITTRDSNPGDLMDSSIVRLECLTTEEAIEWMSKLLDITIAVDDLLHRELAIRLGNLPLAIVQACAYLNHHKCSVSAYLAQLGTILFADRNEQARKIISKTWSISLKSIREEMQAVTGLCYPEEIIISCSFIAGRNIPVLLVEKIIANCTNRKELLSYYVDAYIGYLLKYSLVKRNPHLNAITVHSLVQEALRHNLPSTSYFDRLLNGFIDYGFSDSVDVANMVHSAVIVSHFAVFRTFFRAVPSDNSLQMFKYYKLCNDAFGSLMRIQRTDVAREIINEGITKLSEIIDCDKGDHMFNELLADACNGYAWLTLNGDQSMENLILAKNRCLKAIDIRRSMINQPNYTSKSLKMFVVCHYTFVNLNDILYLQFGVDEYLPHSLELLIDLVFQIERGKSPFENFKKTNPHEYSQCYHTLADVYKSCGDFETALIFFDVAIAHNVNKDPYLSRKKAEILILLEQCDDARQILYSCLKQYQERNDIANSHQVDLNILPRLTWVYGYLLLVPKDEEEFKSNVSWFEAQLSQQCLNEIKASIQQRANTFNQSRSKWLRGEDYLVAGQKVLSEMKVEFQSTLCSYKNMDSYFFSQDMNTRFYFATGTPLFPAFEPLTKLPPAQPSDMRLYKSPVGITAYRSSMSEFFQAEMYVENIDYNNVIFTTGVTGAFASFLTTRLKNEFDAILVPIPSYGLFISQIYFFKREVIPVPLFKENNWKVQPGDIEKAIFKGKKYLRKVKSDHNLSWEPQIRGFLHINPHNPTGAVYEEDDILGIATCLSKYPAIEVFDNCAYFGLTRSKQDLFSFMRLTEFANRTLLVVAISKIFSSTTYRAAAVCCSTEIVKSIANFNLQTIGFVMPTSQLALSVAFSRSENDILIRNLFCENSRNEYNYRFNLMISLVYGKRMCSYFPVIVQQRIGNDIRLYASPPGVLDDGIPGLKLLCCPRGAYFNLLDFSFFRLMSFEGRPLESSYQIVEYFCDNIKLLMIPGELMLLTPSKLVTRVSFALEPSVMIQGFSSMAILLRKKLSDHGTWPSEKECNESYDEYVKMLLEE